MPTTSNPTLMYVIGAVVVLLIIIAAIALSRRSRSTSLQKRFGPEYERTIRETGSRADAERELAQREDRVKRMHIEELPPGAKNRYSEEWRTVQTRFVDEPKAALVNADQLIANVMRDRGYPTDDFNQSVADLSPDHPQVLENYRTAHEITRKSETGTVSTEDLRQAMVHYRSLFDDLVE